ncbi:MAG: GAF domain-containing protein, partial [Chloroflexota bacterium]
MFSFSLIVILAGAIILLGIGVWTNQRRTLGTKPEIEHDLQMQAARFKTDNAVVVAREHGQLIYINDKVRDWLGVGTGSPSLEYLAQNAQPEDNFRELFIGEARAAFRFGTHWVEGWSNMIPSENEMRVVVTMRELQHQTSLPDDENLDVSRAMLIIEEIGDTVNAGLGVEQSMQTILTILSKNIELDGAEFTMWDPTENALFQRGWVGDAAYALSLALAGGSYPMGEGLTGWVAQNQEPLLVPDINAPDSLAPMLSDNPYNSFVVVPIALGDRFLGTLELTSANPGHFNRAHLSLLQAVTKPIATAIYNAELYTEQVQRIEDIASIQQITQNEDLITNVASVYMAMNKRIADLVGVEVAGVLLFDERRIALIPQAPFFGLPDQLVTVMGAIPVGDADPAVSIWRDQAYWIANDLDDEPLLDEIGLGPAVAAAGLRNIMLFPMTIGQQRIGMMLLANTTSLTGFSSADAQNLRILVTQAAIVVENIRLYQREQRQDTELVGLQEITHAIGALSSDDTDYVYSDINTRIAGLMNIQMCGVLLYDASRNALVAQLPFFGVDDDELRDYAIDLSANEVIEELWTEEDYWYTNRAQRDTIVFSAGLAEMAERIGVQKTLLASLTAGGQKIGVIQVADKYSGDDFSDNDARLLLIFATQAAAILENARLVQEVQRRAAESERLRSIAERAGNVVTLDDSLAPVLSEVSALTDSSLVFLSVIHEESGALVMTPRSVFGAELEMAIRYDHETEHFEECVAVVKEPLITNDAAEDVADRVPYQKLVDRLGINRMVIVPLVIGERSLGELGIANRHGGHYSEDDLDLLTTIGAQLSSTIDRVRLFEAAGQSLDRRVKELDAISHVSSVLNQTIDLDQILSAIHAEASEATGAQGGTVAVLHRVDSFDPETSTTSTRLAYRVGGKPEGRNRLGDIEAAAIEDSEGVIVVENYEDTQLAAQPYEAVSAVALVFAYANIPVGVLHLFDSRPSYFDERSVSFLRTLGSKAALGYGNAVRYSDQMKRSSVLRQRVEQLNQIFELGQMLQTNVDQDMMLEAIVYSIVQSVGFDVVVVTMIDPASGLLKREQQAGLPVDAFERSKADVLPADRLETILRDEFRISESYFLPIESIIKMEIAGLDALSAAYASNRSIHVTGEDAWHDGDMLLVPISGANSQLLGLISLDRPQDNKRPTRTKIEILEIFAHQAATTIENNRLYLNSVQSAEQEARLNEMLEDIASTLDIEEIIGSVAHNALRLAPFGRMTAAIIDGDGYIVYDLTVRADDTLVTTVESHTDLDGTALGTAIRDNRELIFTPEDEVHANTDVA